MAGAQEHWQTEDEDEDEELRDEDESLGMEGMTRIMTRKTYPEDEVFDPSDVGVLPVALTSREGTVEMGWRV